MGLLVQVAVIALVIFGVRAIRNSRADAPIGVRFRNFFQYLVILVLLFAGLSGLSGLLGMLADRADFVSADPSQLALNLSLLLVGAPLFAIAAVSTKKRIATHPSETSSFGWTFFISISVIITLIVVMFGLYGTLRFILGTSDYDGFALAQAIVWGTAWFGLDVLDRRFSPSSRADLRHVVAALIGLATGAVAVGRLITALGERLGQPGSLNAVMVGDTNSIASSIALLVVATPVWIRYWIRGLSLAPESDGWRLHVVLFGVAGGFITAVVSAATMLYSIVVWFLGSPVESAAGDHFDSLPSSIGSLAAGLVVWWYHRAVLAMRTGASRTEIDRTYDYVMATGGLIASATGVVILLAAFVEALAGGRLLRGDSEINTLILAVILLVLGLPVWWAHWRSVESRCSGGEAHERGSVSRRLYLVALIGVGGLVALGTGIATVYLFLRDVIDGTLSTSTFRSIRYPLATLITAGAVALYHLGFYRADHEQTVPKRRVVLVGPRDDQLEQQIRDAGNVEVERVATAGGIWQHGEVVGILASQQGDIVVSLTPAGTFGVPLDPK